MLVAGRRRVAAGKAPSIIIWCYRAMAPTVPYGRRTMRAMFAVASAYLSLETPVRACRKVDYKDLLLTPAQRGTRPNRLHTPALARGSDPGRADRGDTSGLY